MNLLDVFGIYKAAYLPKTIWYYLIENSGPLELQDDQPIINPKDLKKKRSGRLLT